MGFLNFMIFMVVFLKQLDPTMYRAIRWSTALSHHPLMKMGGFSIFR